MDATFRDEHDADRAEVRRLVAAAFGGEHVPQLLDRMRTAPEWVGLSHVAEVDGALVGHVAFTRAQLDTRHELVDVLVLSPLAVHPDHQEQGVAAGLVRWALARLEASDWPMVFLEGAPGYYRRFGFHPGEEHGFRRPSLRIPAPAFQVLLLPAAEGWMTGTLVYPQFFWELDSVGLRDPELRQVESALGVNEGS